MEKQKGGESSGQEKERTNGMNLSVLQRLDNKITKVLGNAGHVALYSFDPDKQEWERKEVEGSLFVAARSTAPFHQVIVLNRLSTDNFVEPITNELEMEVVQPYLLFRNKLGEITGVWFYKKTEQAKITQVIQGILNELENKKKAPADKAAAAKQLRSSPGQADKQASSKSSQTDNVKHQKDNRNSVAEKSNSLEDNRSDQLRTSGSKAQTREEVPMNGYPSPAQARKPPENTTMPNGSSFQPKAFPGMTEEEFLKQFMPHDPRMAFPGYPSPYPMDPRLGFPYPQQVQYPLPFPQAPSPHPPHPHPHSQPHPHPHPHSQPHPHPHPHPHSPPQPVPSPIDELFNTLQQMPQQQRPPQMLHPHPNQMAPPPQIPHPQPAHPPPGFAQTPPPQKPPGGIPDSSHQISPDVFVQQLSRAIRPTGPTPPVPNNPPITKENIKEILTALAQDDRFVAMVHEAYLAQVQKGS